MADEYVVERSMHVAAPASALYERIVDLRRWQAWSPWEDVDPDMLLGPDFEQGLDRLRAKVEDG